jgi:alpha-glucosidase
LRRSHAALSVGAYEPLAAAGEVLTYWRRTAEERVLIALNLGSEPCMLTVELFGMQGKLLLSTHLDRMNEVVVGELSLRANEGVIVALATQTASAGA